MALKAIKGGLSPDEDNYEHIINIRHLAMYLADVEWEKKIVHVHPRELYDTEVVEGHGFHEITTLKPKYNDMYWELVNDYEEIILQFEKEKEEDGSIQTEG